MLQTRWGLKKARTAALRIFFSAMAAILLFCVVDADARALTPETKYAGVTPLEAVLAQNERIMGSGIDDADDYGPEFVVDYIVENGTREEIIAVLDDIHELSDEIVKDCATDEEKIHAIADYVAANTAYDFDAKHNDVSFDTICLKNVMERKRTTCAGFSNFFSALVQAQDIPVANVRGSSPEGTITREKLDDDMSPINHEWTAAWLESESRWLYVDCTWNSGSQYYRGSFTWRDAKQLYYDISAYYLAIDHKADSSTYRRFFDAPKAFVTITTSTSGYVTKTTTTAKTGTSVFGGTTHTGSGVTTAYSDLPGTAVTGEVTTSRVTALPVGETTTAPESQTDASGGYLSATTAKKKVTTAPEENDERFAALFTESDFSVKTTVTASESKTESSEKKVGADYYILKYVLLPLTLLAAVFFAVLGFAKKKARR